jgi:hypothetical protein
MKTNKQKETETILRLFQKEELFSDNQVKGYEKFMSPPAKDRIMADILGKGNPDMDGIQYGVDMAENVDSDEETDYEAIWKEGYNQALEERYQLDQSYIEQTALEMIQSGTNNVVKGKLASMVATAICNMSQDEIDYIKNGEATRLVDFKVK